MEATPSLPSRSSGLVEFDELLGPGAAGGGGSEGFVAAAEAALIHALGLHARHDLGGCNMHPGRGRAEAQRLVLDALAEALAPELRPALAYTWRCLRAGGGAA
jgi:hypothetical protein